VCNQTERIGLASAYPLFAPDVCAGQLPRSLYEIVESLGIYQRRRTVLFIAAWGLAPRIRGDFSEIGQGVKLGVYIKERIVRVLPNQQNRRRLR
jgi:hypothetical protein